MTTETDILATFTPQQRASAQGLSRPAPRGTAIPVTGDTTEPPKPVSPPAALRGEGRISGPISDAFDTFVKKIRKAIDIANDPEKFKKHKAKQTKRAEKAKAKEDEEKAEENKKKAAKEYGVAKE